MMGPYRSEESDEIIRRLEAENARLRSARRLGLVVATLACPVFALKPGSRGRSAVLSSLPIYLLGGMGMGTVTGWVLMIMTALATLMVAGAAVQYDLGLKGLHPFLQGAKKGNEP